MAGSDVQINIVANDSASATIKKVQSAIKQLNATASQMKTALSQANTQAKLMQQHMQKLATNGQKANQALRDTATSANKAKSALGQVNSQTTKAQQGMAKLTTQLNQTNTAIGKTKTSMGHMSSQMNKTTDSTSKMTTQMSKATTASEKMGNTMATTQYKVAQTETRMGKLGTQLGTTATAVNKATESVKQLDTAHTTLGKTITQNNAVLRQNASLVQGTSKASKSASASSQEMAGNYNKASTATEGWFSKLSKLTSGLWVVSSAVTTVVSAVKTVIDTVYDASSTFEQLSGGIEALFQENPDAGKGVIEDAKTAYKTSQQSMNEYLENATSFSAKLNANLNGNLDSVRDYIKVANTAMADNAATFGTSLTTLQETFESLSRGEGRLLDNLKLGYGGTKTELERMLTEFKEATNDTREVSTEDFSMIIDAIQWAQEEQHVAGRAAEEASTTLEGSANAMKSAWENLMTVLGDTTGSAGDVNTAMTQFTDAFVTWEGNFHGFMEKLNSSLDTIADSGASDSFGEAIREMFNDIGTTISKLLPVATEVLTPIGIQLLSGLASGLFAGCLQGLSTLDYLGVASQIGSAIKTGIVNSIKQSILGDNSQDTMKNIGDVIIGWFKNLNPSTGFGTALGEVVGGWIENLNIGDTIAKAIKGSNFVQAFSKIGQGLAEAFPKIFEGLKEGIPTAISGLKESLASAFTSLFSGIGDWFSSTSITDGIGSIKATIAEMLNGVIENIEDAINSKFGLEGTPFELHIPRIEVEGGDVETDGVESAVDDAIDKITEPETVDKKVNVNEDADVEDDSAQSKVDNSVDELGETDSTDKNVNVNETASVNDGSAKASVNSSVDGIPSATRQAIDKTIKAIIGANPDNSSAIASVNGSIAGIVSATTSSIKKQVAVSITAYVSGNSSNPYTNGKIIGNDIPESDSWQSGSTGINGGESNGGESNGLDVGGSVGSGGINSIQGLGNLFVIGKIINQTIANGINEYKNIASEAVDENVASIAERYETDFESLQDKIKSIIDEFETEVTSEYNAMQDKIDAMERENDWYDIVEAQREYNEKSALAIGADEGYDTEEAKLKAKNNLDKMYLEYDMELMKAEMDRIDQAKEDAEEYVDTWTNAYEEVYNAIEDLYNKLSSEDFNLFSTEEVTKGNRTKTKVKIANEKSMDAEATKYTQFAEEISKMREKGYPDSLVDSIIDEYSGDVDNGIKIAQKFNSKSEEEQASWITSYSNLQSAKASSAWVLSNQETTLSDATAQLMSNINTLAQQVSESISPDLASEISSLKDGLTLKIDCEGSNSELGKLLTEIINEYKLTWGV